MAASVIINRGKRLGKRVYSCMLLQKKMAKDEDFGMPRYINLRETFLFSVGVILASFYEGMPRVISEFGYMIFFPLLVSGMMSSITGICFAELVTLNPNSGGTYRYVYYTMGELMGFLVGWCCIYSSFLEIVDKSAIMTKTIDLTVFDGQVGNFTSNHLPIGGLNNYFLQILPYAEVQNFVILLSMTGAWIIGVKWGAFVIDIVASINLVIIGVCITIFWFYLDFSKFNILRATEDFTFFTEGSVQCHLFYMDFEVTLYAGAEAVDPKYSIPKGLLKGFHVGFLIYMSSLILYTPSKATAERQSGIDPVMKNALWGLGFKNFCELPTIGLVLSYYLGGRAAVYEGTRVLFTMARDGLIFPIFGRVNQRFKNPLIAHVFVGIIAYLVSVFVGVSPTTKWTIVAVETIIRIMVLIGYLVTKYRCETEDESFEDPEVDKKRWVLINFPNSVSRPTKTTHNISMLLIFLSVITIVSTELIMVVFIIGTKNEGIHLRIGFIISAFTALVSVQLLSQQPINKRRNFPYEVRGLPYTPILSITWYILILTFLPQIVWIKITCWLTIGIIFYISFSLLNSEEYKKQKAAEEVESIPEISVPVNKV